MTGIEPAYSAWEADVLPLNYIRTASPGKPSRSAEPDRAVPPDAAEPAGGSPRDLAQYLKTDYERWGRVVKQAGIRGE